MLPVIFHVVAEGQSGAFLIASGRWGLPATSDGGAGEFGSCPNFRLWETPIYMLLYGASNLDEGSKRVIIRARICLLESDVFLNFGNQTPQN